MKSSRLFLFQVVFISWVTSSTGLATTTASTTVTPSSSPSSSNAPIIVSGAGPAALIFCHRILRLDPKAKVVVYEKRERPKRYVDIDSNECVAGDYAFGFGLSQRSQDIIAKTDGLLEAVKAISQPTSFAPGIDLRLVNRRELCAELLYELEKDFIDSDRLQIKFGSTVTDVNKDKRTISVMENSGDESVESIPSTIEYSLLVAADGANSLIRNKLVDCRDINSQQYLADVTWKALQLPEQPNLEASAFPRYRTTIDNGALIPRFKNRFVMLNFRKFGRGGDKDLQAARYPFGAKNPEALREAISKAVPEVTEFPEDDVLQTFLDQRPGREYYMKLDRHALPDSRIALIGDASVGMYSLFGQGCSNAMQQADLLADKLSKCDTEVALQEYSSMSVVEGHAITDLNLITHSLRKKGLIKIWALFQMMGIGKTLATKPDLPYSKVLKRFRFAVWVSKIFWRRNRIPRGESSQTSN